MITTNKAEESAAKKRATPMMGMSPPKGGFKIPPIGKGHRRIVESAIAGIEANGWDAETRTLTEILLRYTVDATQLLDRVRRHYPEDITLMAWERKSTQDKVLDLLRKVLA